MNCQDIKFAEVEERFWSHVNVSGSDSCWPWTAWKNDRGRGYTTYKGKNISAPRMAWMIHNNKEIPTGMMACHSCDNPSCCNPGHIWIGTCADNLRDAALKHRMPSGDRHYHGKQDRCFRGHAFNTSNTDIKYNGERICKTCRNAVGRLNRLFKKGAWKNVDKKYKTLCIVCPELGYDGCSGGWCGGTKGKLKGDNG